jgi:hypothetical protein
MMMLLVYESSLVTICQRVAEKLAYFLFGGFAVEYDWLSRIFLQEIIYIAILGGLIVSPDIENKFEIYSCEERGVKTHLH